MHIISRDPAPPPLAYIRVSGGMFLDMTIHDFDMARFLIGDEVEEVYTSGGVMVDPEIGEAGDLDTALIVLRFNNGVIGTIDNSRQAAYGYDQRVEILGSRGSIGTQNCYPNQAVISTGHRDPPGPAAELFHGPLYREFRRRGPRLRAGGPRRSAYARGRNRRAGGRGHGHSGTPVV